MSNISNRLLEMNIDAKITTAIQAEAMNGIDVANMDADGRRRVVDAVKTNVSGNEFDLLVERGLQFVIKQVIGEKIAEEIWNSGLGMDATHAEVMAAGRKLRIAEADINECYLAFMENIGETTRDSAEEFPTLAKFAPLFEGEPEGMTLGEVAERKAAAGDKLAMSFLAWKEVA